MEPLASKIRPKNLDEFVGQEHLVGDDKPLRMAINEGHLMSFILWGPPGSGKTTLARIYANALNAEFHELSAVDAGKDDVKKFGGLPIPMKIRNAPTKLMKNLNYGKGYEKYDKESYLPDKLKNKKYLK